MHMQGDHNIIRAKYDIIIYNYKNSKNSKITENVNFYYRTECSQQIKSEACSQIHLNLYN